MFNVILEKSNLAHLERKLGNYRDALEYYRETIVTFRNIAQIGAVAHQLECFGFISLAQEQNKRALQLFAAASALREQRSTPMTPEEQIHFDEQLKVLHERMNSLKILFNMDAGPRHDDGAVHKLCPGRETGMIPSTLSSHSSSSISEIAVTAFT